MDRFKFARTFVFCLSALFMAIPQIAVAQTVSGILIKTPPKMSYEHGDALDLTSLEVTLEYSDATPDKDVAFTNFVTENITTVPADGTQLSISNDSLTVIYNDNTDSVSVTIAISVSAIEIDSASITVTAPVTGVKLDTIASGTVGFTVSSVTWNSNDTIFLGNTPYTVTVTLTADTGYTFTSISNATINGAPVIPIPAINTDSTLTLSYQFLATAPAEVTNILIKTQPKMSYKHGDALDLTGLEVKLEYNDASTLDVPFGSFATNNITTDPADGVQLSISDNNSTIKVKYDNGSVKDSVLTTPISVSAAEIATAAVTVTAPADGVAPSTTAIVVTGDFTVSSVSWSPIPAGTGGTFEDAIAYTVTITLTADTGFEFDVNTAATINDSTAIVTGMGGGTLTFEYTFPPTGTGTPTPPLTSITTAAVTLTAPATDGTPAATVTGLNFTAAVAWSPVVAANFLPSTQYTAMVTLTADSGFEFDVSSTATINGTAAAATLNGNGTLTFSHIFPATGAGTPTPIPITAVDVTVTAPAGGVAPSTTAIVVTGDFTVDTVTWSPAVATFQAGTQYTATITLAANSGYTFAGGASSATINGFSAAISPNIAGDSASISYQFTATGTGTPTPPLTSITTAAITVTAPATDGTPATASDVNIVTGDFTVSTVSWSPNDAAFQASTQYTVSVTLTADTGFEFGANTAATINDSTAIVTGTPGVTLTFTYTFPATGAGTPPPPLTSITTAAVTVTAPATDGTPATVADINVGSANFTVSSVTWNDSDNPFQAGKAYTATITLAANSGFEFVAGFTATINDSTAIVTGMGGTTVISYTFPATGAGTPPPPLTSITTAAVTVTAPATGGTPAATVTGLNFTAAVAWSPVVAANFLPSTQYTAMVTLTADSGYTFANILASATTINGQTATIVGTPGVTLTFTYTFPATGAGTPPPSSSVSNIVISQSPRISYEHGDTLDLSGLAVTLKYNDGTPDEEVTFASFTTKGISVLPNNGTILDITQSSNTIVISHNASSKYTTLAIMVTKAKITEAAVSVTAPVIGEVPSTLAEIDSGKFTGAVVWTPTVATFQANTAYTATVTLTVTDTGYTFTGISNAKINGENSTSIAVDSTGKVLTLSYTFPAINLPEISIAVITQPKLIYSDGDTLDLSTLKVKITDTGKEEIIAFADFATKGISTDPVNGTILRSQHHGSRINVIYNDGINARKTAFTEPLFVASFIESAALEINKPISGETPSTKDSVRFTNSGFYVHSIVWTPEHATFQSGKQYTVIITLAVNEGFAFDNRTVVSLNRETPSITIGNKGATLTLSYTFQPTTAIVVVKIGDQIIDPSSDNKLEFVTKCSDGSDLQNVSVSPGLEGGFIHGGGDFDPNNLILDFGENLFKFTVPDADGNHHDYTLNIIKPLEMVKLRWGNTLAVIDNHAFDKYVIDTSSYIWYRNGREVGKGWFWSTSNGEPINTRDVYYVEAKTEKGKIRSCEYQRPMQMAAREYGILVKNSQMNAIGLEIITPEKAETEIFIYNISGSLVHKLRGNSIKEANIPSGLYLVKAKAKGESGAVYRYSTKLVVKK